MKAFRSRVAAFLHQVNFLALAAYGKTTFTWTDAAGHLVKATRATLSQSHRATDPDDDGGEDMGQGDPNIHGLHEMTQPDALWALPTELCDKCGHLHRQGNHIRNATATGKLRTSSAKPRLVPTVAGTRVGIHTCLLAIQREGMVASATNSGKTQAKCRMGTHTLHEMQPQYGALNRYADHR